VKRRLAVVFIGSLVIAAPLQAAAKVRVTARGAVGPLRMDRSTRADVIAFAGKPDAETHLAKPYEGSEALGYGCPGRRAVNQFGEPSCKTAFYIDVRSGLLEELYTEDPRYVGPHGIHARTTNVRAAHLLEKPLPWMGCQAQDLIYTPTGLLAIVLGKQRVAFLVLVAHKHDAGVFDCIDS
jgi:hypothetical protein